MLQAKDLLKDLKIWLVALSYHFLLPVQKYACRIFEEIHFNFLLLIFDFLILSARSNFTKMNFK